MIHSIFTDFRTAIAAGVIVLITIAYPVTTLDFGVKGGVNLFDKDINLKS